MGWGEAYWVTRVSQESGEERCVTNLAIEGEYQCILVDIKERSGNNVFNWRDGESIYDFFKDGANISVKVILFTNPSQL